METRRFLITIALSVSVLVIWGYLFPPEERGSQDGSGVGTTTEALQEPSAESRPIERAAEVASPEPSADARRDVSAQQPEVTGQTEEPLRAAMADREETVVVERATFRAEISNRGAQMVSFRLKEHTDRAGQPLDLVRARAGDTPYPFGLVEPNGEPSPLNSALFQVEQAGGAGGEEVTFTYKGPAGEATKVFRFNGDELFETEVVLPERLGRTVLLGPGIRNPTAKELDNRFARKSAIFATADDTEKLDPNREATPQIIPGGGLRWVGLQDTYFLKAMVFKEPVDQVTVRPELAVPSSDGSVFRPRPEELSDDEEELVLEMSVLVRPFGGRLSVVSFWGPKIYDELRALNFGLEESVALGPFGFLARPLLFGLRWIHANVVGNYGWAIILMTLAIRIVLFPLNHKSVVSMQRMQEVNPKIQAIRQKYRSKLKDKKGRPNAEMQRKQNEEIMALYKTEGINPAGGCLPLLLQIPVLFAFYSLLSTAIELRLAPWLGWIQDLSAPDPYLVLPIVMGATQFLQQKLTPSSADPAQRRIFMLMPIFFTILFLGFPSGLVLYWLTNNVLGIAQQVVYSRIKNKRAAAEAA